MNLTPYNSKKDQDKDKNRRPQNAKELNQMLAAKGAKKLAQFNAKTYKRLSGK